MSKRGVNAAFCYVRTYFLRAGAYERRGKYVLFPAGKG